jgi:Ca2+-transporting ATPase
MRVNEASLTGESLAVDKNTEPIPEDTPLAERSNMVYKGTSVARGTGEGVVVSIGMDTELGNITSLVQKAEEEVTPLEERLDALGRKLIWVTLGLSAVIALSGWASGRDLRLMIETAIALAVASIPEGLPIVATVALARGMHRMAKKNALINKLSSVETLGATSVIISDKTGTLTENQMTVTNILLPEGDVEVDGEGLELEGKFSWVDSDETSIEDTSLKELLKICVLCNNASLTINDGEVQETIGEPMEIALKVVGRKADINRESLTKKLPEVDQVAFEQSTKMMATIHEDEEKNQFLYAVKGSLEAVLDASTKYALPESDTELTEKLRKEWIKKNEDLANRGLRVLAIAKKVTESKNDDPYQNLSFLGLVGLMDPPREEIKQAIESCKTAGIRVIMATGDHGETAREIAKSVNLISSDNASYLLGKDLKNNDELSEDRRQKVLDTQIFARVEPEQKLNLIDLHQSNGAVVAMTGDGVNDAPALKKADIGVAMGQRGTQVAKEAADMVLKDDFFGTIVSAVEQGRAIFNNIRKFVLYLLSCNISEIMVVTLASVLNMPLPILPLQILFLNLVTDVFPALALGMGEGDAQLMKEPPRDSDEPIMTKSHWITTGIFGLLITGAVMIGLILSLKSLGFTEAKATTISFLILAFAQLWHVFDMHENEANIFVNSVTKNQYVWFSLLICIILLLIAVYVPFMANLLSLVNPGFNGWLVVISASLAPMMLGQVLKSLRLIK